MWANEVAARRVSPYRNDLRLALTCVVCARRLTSEPANHTAMKILVRIILFLIVLAVAAYLYGRSIPAHQTHARTITLKQTPEAVFTLLTDLPNFPKWNRNMEKIEMLPPIDGKEATRQTFKGNMVMTIVTSESTPPKHLVRSMGDSGGPFEGSWIYDITPTADGSQVVLTEQSTYEQRALPIHGETVQSDQIHGRTPSGNGEAFWRNGDGSLVRP